ncbi:MAG: Uma2 family endonuclease [Actinomycetes bacterium]
MSTVTVIEVDDDFTADALDELPDDGNRYELVDGLLLVSPSPTERHQRALGELFVQLRAAAPPGLRVYAAPLDVRFSMRVQTQPDLLVVEDGPPREKLERLPLLCVELLSPGTRRHDVVLKRRAYERERVASYWLVDPDEPSLAALELRDGVHVEVARVEGEQAWTAERPYPVTVVPADLLR